MSREEILKKLHNIRVAAQPTVVTQDMGLQYEYVTSEGYGDGFGNMGDWPVYRLEISSKKMEIIKEKIADGSLIEDDLANTDLLAFYRYVFSIERPEQFIPSLASFFSDLLKVELAEDGVFYALCDAGQWEPEAYFLSSYDELEEAFTNDYVTYVEEWEDLSDEDLEDWLKRIEEDLNCIPFVILKEENE